MTDVTSIPHILDRERKRVKTIIEVGLDPAYTNFDDFLWDFYPDFSWNVNESKAQLIALSEDPEWVALTAELKAKRGFDFVETVTKAIEARHE